MKLRPWITGLFGVVAFAATNASALAAPISTMSELARSDVLAVTNVVQRKHRASQARNRGGSNNPNTNRTSTTDWHDLDSNNLQFGSRQWWDQHPSGPAK
jgi:hypothetical protein